MSAEAPKTIFASPEAIDAYWQTFAEIGPRHRNVARWVYVLGWTIDPRALREYLAPEAA